MRTPSGRKRKGSQHAGWRLPAQEIEQAVAVAIKDLLQDRGTLATELLAGGATAEQLPTTLDQLEALGKDAPREHRDDQPSSRWSGSLLQRVDLSTSRMVLTLGVQVSAAPMAEADASEASSTILIRHLVPHCIRRRGVEMRLVIEMASTPPREDAALLKMVARAHCWFEEIASGRAASAHAIAHRLGLHPRYVQRLLPLALLAPSLVEQIIAGQHPAGLTAEELQRHPELPWSWAEQVTASS